jgi:LCP family protein required for cell wall assembly
MRPDWQPLSEAASQIAYAWSDRQSMRDSGTVRRWLGLVLAAVLGLGLGSVLAVISFVVPLGGRANPRPPAAATPVTPPAGANQSEAAGALATQDGTPTAQPPVAPDPTRPSAAAGRRVTVLLLGIDTRPDEPVGRTDSMMLLTYDPDTNSTGMISMARDLLVTIPGIRGKAKINTANFFGDANRYPGGGPALASRTVADFLGYPVNYYVRINFDGFRQIIDQIGGIDIDVPQAINDPLYPDNNYGYDPLYIPAGHIHMDGALALKYARTRHDDSDYGRARRQQQVVKAVEAKLLQPSNLAMLLPRLPGLAMTLGKSLQTNMPLNQAIALAHQLSQAGQGNTKNLVIDDAMGVDSTDPTWGFVLIPNMPKVRAAVAGVFGDQAGELASTAADPTVAEEAARVAVLNGTPHKELTTEVANRLADQGLHVVGTGDADHQDYLDTWLIIHGDAAPASKATLVRLLGIAPDHIRAEPADGATDFIVVLGTDQATARAALP